MQPMNISILSMSDIGGGAAIAANRLMHGLRMENHNAVMIVREKRIPSSNSHQVIVNAPQFRAQERIFHAIQRDEINNNRSKISNTLFSIPYPGIDLSSTPIIEKSHIINLHWVARFQSTETIAALLATGKPVVWTLHDENAYTGGCHYTAGCTKYLNAEAGCKDCLQIQDKKNQAPYYFLQNKIASWGKNLENLTIVTPSRWLGRCARQSHVFKNARVEVIPNSVETDIFKPYDKQKAKKKFGIPPQAFTLLFGAYTDFEKRKGFAKLLDAMKYCLRDKTFMQYAKAGKIKIMTYGPPQEDLEDLPIEIISTGYTSEKEKLATIYSAADLFILPSLEDNLPNTMVEAMACGTPVLGFDTGGIPDMVRDDVTGYILPCPDIEKLGERLKQLVLAEDKTKLQHLGKNCRKLIEKSYKLKDQGKNYSVLFRDLLKKRQHSITVPIEVHSSKAANASPIIIKTPGTPVSIHEKLYPLFWKHALNALIDQEKYIQRIHRSFTFRFVRLVLSPLRKIKTILNKKR